jgi:hypothetical protein
MHAVCVYAVHLVGVVSLVAMLMQICYGLDMDLTEGNRNRLVRWANEG